MAGSSSHKSPDKQQQLGGHKASVSLGGHRREKIHQCVICSERVRGTAETVAVHLAKHRLEVGGRLAFRCPHCNVALMKLKKLLEHIDAMHSSSGTGTAAATVASSPAAAIGKLDKAEEATAEAVTEALEPQPDEEEPRCMPNSEEVKDDSEPVDLSRTSSIGSGDTGCGTSAKTFAIEPPTTVQNNVTETGCLFSTSDNTSSVDAARACVADSVCASASSLQPVPALPETKG